MSDVQTNTALTFHGVEILSVQFETEQRYDNSTPITFDFKPKVFFPPDEHNAFVVIMEAHLAAPTFFSVTVTATGRFELQGEISEETRKQFAHINAAAIMFPYVRAFITNFTASLGTVTGAITIPVQFFQGTLEEFTPSEAAQLKEAQ
ncbi:MAG: protein-export chaperone SecB [Candidatus Kapabacteria bacterium]|nr:protein-export chaperone SecB [Candidatus Kapabacteria bacterium]